jgi:peptidoglycan/LPS O-acetylase OafA/YrhL
MFWEPFTLPIVLLSFFIFILLNSFQVAFPKIFFNSSFRKLVEFISEISFGIYIVHILLLEYVDKYFKLSIHFITYPLYIYYFQRISYLLFASVFFAYLIYKTPIIKNIFGIRNKA